MRIPPYDYVPTVLKTYYSGTNESVVVLRKGFLREIHFWNTTRANAGSVVLDEIDRPAGELVDLTIGVRDDNPFTIRIPKNTGQVSAGTTGNNLMGSAVYIADESV